MHPFRIPPRSGTTQFTVCVCGRLCRHPVCEQLMYSGQTYSPLRLNVAEAIFDEETLARHKIEASTDEKSKAFNEGVLCAIRIIQKHIEDFIG